MTSHRTTIRRAAIALLEADPVFAAATRVLHGARVDAESLPCFSVATPAEEQKVLGTRNVEVKTQLVVVMALTAEQDDLEDLLDTRADLIRDLILDGLSAQAGPQNVRLTRTEFKPGPEDKTIIGRVMMLFEVIGYLTET